MVNPIFKREDRPSSDNIPFYQRTDLTEAEKKKLLTIEDMLARSSGNINDSIWAPGNEKKLAAAKLAASNRLEKQPVRSFANNSTATPIKKELATAAIKIEPNSSYTSNGMTSGLGSSRWSSTPKHPSVRTGPNPMAPSFTPAALLPQAPVSQIEMGPPPTTPQLPPHLQTTTSYQKVVPPHLRTMARAAIRSPSCTLTEAPSNVGIIPQSLTPDATAMAALKRAVVQADDASVAAPSFGLSENSAMMPVQPPRPVTEEDPFLAFISKKAVADANAKKAALAQKIAPVDGSSQVGLPEASPNPWGQPPARKIGVTRHDHFNVDVGTLGAEDFHTFLKRKEDEPTSGKRYTAVSEQPAQPKSSSVQKQLTNTKEEQRAIGVSYDPHAVFSPTQWQGLAGANTAPMLSKSFDDNTSSPSAPQIASTSEQVHYLAEKPAALQPQMEASEQNALIVHASQDHSAHITVVTQGSNRSKAPKSESSGRWEIPFNMEQMGQDILHDLNIKNQPLIKEDPQTAESMIMKLGMVPRQSVDSLDERISDDGVEKCGKENIRATQGKSAAEELLDWDKTWLPPPCVWEDRGPFDTSYITTYIQKDWLLRLHAHHAVGEVWFDLDEFNFVSGRSAVNRFRLDAPLIHEDTIPDTQNSTDEMKRLHQTAEFEALRVQKKLEKQTRNSNRYAKSFEANHMAILAAKPAPHPFAPAMDIYLRPAVGADVIGIASIYNYYVQNSFITEDQSPVSEKDWAENLKVLGDKELPFIVAVKGPMPVAPVVGNLQNRRAPKAILPRSEEIVGFALAQPFNFGFGGLHTGRSRTTLDLQLYVHDQYTRKGVGRSLLDRLVQCLSSGYGAKDGYSWLNPTDDPVYKSGGTQYWHQLIIQYPVKMEQDPSHTWMTNFLSKHSFFEDVKLKRMGRTAVNTSSILEFLDIILFCHVGTSQGEFPQIV